MRRRTAAVIRSRRSRPKITIGMEGGISGPAGREAPARGRNRAGSALLHLRIMMLPIAAVVAARPGQRREKVAGAPSLNAEPAGRWRTSTRATLSGASQPAGLHDVAGQDEARHR